MDEGLNTTMGQEKSRATKTDTEVKDKIFLLTLLNQERLNQMKRGHM